MAPKIHITSDDVVKRRASSDLRLPGQGSSKEAPASPLGEKKGEITDSLSMLPEASVVQVHSITK